MTTPSVYTSSGSVTTFDTVPKSAFTTGEGVEGQINRQDDYIHLTTAMLAAGQGWRMCRIPTTAKIKAVRVMADAAIDAGSSQGLAMQFSLAFSDSTIDGTPAALQGQVPTTANTGATTPPTTYTSPNALFGTVTLSGNDLKFGDNTSVLTSGAIVTSPLDIVFNGGSLLYNSLLITDTPAWQLFGFVNGQGYPADPGGFFDLLVVVTVSAGTAAAGNFYASIDFVK